MMRPSPPLTLFIALGAAAACGSDTGANGLFGDTGCGGGNHDGGGDGGNSDDGGDGGDDGDDGDGTDGDGGAGDDGGVKFDTPGGTGGPGDDGGTGEACKKVDFLFDIDNSGSMGNKQTVLANSFPGFISAIRTNVAAADYHIMVTDGDGVAAMQGSQNGCFGDCNSYCGACTPGNICICTCNGVSEVCEDPNASCDDTHGAGVVRDQAGTDCGIAGGQRYMTGAQPNLEGTFQCVALVGDYGMAFERPVTGAIKALTDESAPGECNEGFLRSDALLVVTFITDDPPGSMSLSQYEDAGYLADAHGWYDAFVAAKGGEPNNVVMLGILDHFAGARVFADFVDLFGDRGLVGDVNAPSYTAFFEEAVKLIDTACDEFVPEG